MEREAGDPAQGSCSGSLDLEMHRGPGADPSPNLLSPNLHLCPALRS